MRAVDVVGLLMVISILFSVLKVIGVLNWQWVVVLAPAVAPVAVGIGSLVWLWVMERLVEEEA